MKGAWLIIGVVTLAAVLVAIVPFLPERMSAVSVVVKRVVHPSAVDVLFVGDIMLDRNVAVHALAVGDDALFEGVQGLFESHDVLVGNLEGTITNNKSVAQQDHSILRFTFDPHFAALLYNVGFNALSLANNHALDFGDFGYEDTVHYLDAAGVVAFGAPFNDQHISIQTSINGKSFCLVGYMELFNPDPTKVLTKIGEERPMCDHIVVMAHWGVEYQHTPTAAQVDLAHQFIDAGADVVIGAHPHVVEPLEIYKNKAIFYSLGNFIFDQGFSPHVMRGLTVGINFEVSKTIFKLVPVTTYKEAAVAGATTTQAVLEDVVTPDLSEDIKNSILKTGMFELDR